VSSWFTWAQDNSLRDVRVKRMEDLILVTGCTLVDAWATATSVDKNIETEISLASGMSSKGVPSFTWSNIRGPIVYYNSLVGPVCPLGYFYLACTDFSTPFVVWKAKSTLDSGSMRLHQGFPNKTHPILLVQSYLGRTSL
jgi:hypothetical protein